MIVVVENLQPGDKVDLEQPPFESTEPAAECMYGIVESVERETPECTVVHFENGFPSHGVPAGTFLQIPPRERTWGELIDNMSRGDHAH